MTKWIKNELFRKSVSKKTIQVKLGSLDQPESGLQVRSNLESIFQIELSALKKNLKNKNIYGFLINHALCFIYFITVDMRNQTMFAQGRLFNQFDRKRKKNPSNNNKIF